MSYKAVNPVVNGSTAILLDESDGFLGYQDRDGEIKPVLTNVGLFANNLITDAEGSGFLGVVDPTTGKEHWIQNEKDGSKVSFIGPQGPQGLQGLQGPQGKPGSSLTELDGHILEAFTKPEGGGIILGRAGMDQQAETYPGIIKLFYTPVNFRSNYSLWFRNAGLGNVTLTEEQLDDQCCILVTTAELSETGSAWSIHSKTLEHAYKLSEFKSDQGIRIGSSLTRLHVYLIHCKADTVSTIMDEAWNIQEGDKGQTLYYSLCSAFDANLPRIRFTNFKITDTTHQSDIRDISFTETDTGADLSVTYTNRIGNTSTVVHPIKDGITPHIGENGNWFIGEEDTSVKAKGPQGDQGQDGRSIFVLDDVDRDALANIIGYSKSELLNLLIDNINSGNESIIASIKEFMKDAGLNWNDYLIIDNWVFWRYIVNKPDGYDYTGRELVKNGEQGPGFRLLSEDEIESLARRIGQHRDSVLPTLLANANGVNPDESIMSGLPEFYSDLGMDNLDIFVFDGYSFQCQKYTEDGQVSLYTYSRISGEDGVDGVNGNTPQLKVEDGFWKVSYDNGDSWEQIAECVGKSDINTINQELSQVGQNVRTLSAQTQGHESILTDINNLLFQGGDWFEDMEELSPEVTGFDQGYSDIPHYIMYHNNILQKDINYESGELPEEESYPLYGEHEGYTDPAYITYNLHGDYCTVSVSNLLLISGWADMYFRLPVEPVEETNMTFIAREGSDYQQVCCTVGHHDYPATGITEPVLWFRTCDTDVYQTDYHVSLTITYKYRNNEDF